jgi:hypothetical protein
MRQHLWIFSAAAKLRRAAEGGPMARPWIEFIFAQHLPWTPGLPGVARGDVSAKILSRDAERGDLTAVVRYPAGWARAKPEALNAEEEFYVLDGAIEIGGRTYGPDTYACLPKGHVRPRAASPGGCVALTFLDFAPEAPEFVEFIDVLSMRWDSKASDPTLEWMGNRRKVLRWDRVHDQKATFVFSTPPHTYPEKWLCPTLTHPCVEESFKLAGEMTGPHGRMMAGAYFWRPANIPHGPFGTHDGAMSIIRFKHGKHVNVWDPTPIPYRYDFPYKPAVPPELAAYAKPYDGAARY